jgi:hypothetical protein
MNAPSIMFLPGKNDVCVGFTIHWAMLVIQLVSTFGKFLKLTFNKHMGLYCVGNLGNFSSNLIQKIAITKRFVTSCMCLCDLSMNTMYVILTSKFLTQNLTG